MKYKHVTCYQTNLACLVHPLPFRKLNISSPQFVQKFLQIINHKYQNDTQILPDSSLNHAVGAGGFEIHIHTRFTMYLKYMTISAIELLTVYQGQERNFPKMVKNTGTQCYTENTDDHSTFNGSYKGLNEISNSWSEEESNFLWVTFRQVSQKTNMLAQIGRDLNISCNHKVISLDYSPWIKNQIQEQFVRQWKDILNTNESSYRLVQQTLATSP